MRLTICAVLLCILCGCSREGQFMQKARREGWLGRQEPVLWLEYRNGAISSCGSAFAISDGEVITAAHTVKGPGIVHLLDRDGRPLLFEVTGISSNVEADIATIHVRNLDARIKRWPVADIRVGMNASAAGYPGDADKTAGATEIKGVVRSSFCYMDGNVKSGMSGGPVVDSSGRAVGVISATIIGDGSTQIRFAPVGVASECK